MKSASIRPLLLSAGVSVAFGIGFALFVGGPQSFMFMALGPIMLLVPLIDRIVERRQQVKGSLDELARELRKFPSPQTLIASGKQTLTWWQAGVEPPTERKTRLGQRSVLVSDFVGGRSKRTVSSLVAIDARGGIEIQGPQWICEAVRMALRFNLAHAYSPFEEVPKVNAGGRWLLRVDASGNARLADRVNPHEAAVEFEVDVVDPENASLVDALERPSTVRGIRDFELRDSSPHMLVSGMTGSGKTEFIVSWLACLAENYEPASLAVAVIDFKGGGSFARIAHLSHVRHIVSDLDPAGLRAAFDGLRAQIQLRERVLLTSGVAHIEDVPSVSRPPRLVLVIDEFFALVEHSADFAVLAADLAARGRALGIHLVVSSQRFANRHSDALLSNIHTRAVFRSSDPLEAQLLLGASVPIVSRLLPGEAMVAGLGAGIEQLKTKLLRPDQREVRQTKNDGQPLWLEPRSTQAPRGVTRAELIPLGSLADHENLRRELIAWNPPAEGVLLCVNANFALRHQVSDLVRACFPSAVTLADSPHEAWDALASLGPGRCHGLLIPHLDSVVSRMPAAWREEFIDLVLDRANAVHLSGSPVVIGFSADNTLLSRFKNLPSSVLSFISDDSMALWRGARMQLYCDPKVTAETEHAEPVPQIDCDEPVLVVTTRPQRWSDVLTGASRACTVNEFLTTPGKTVRVVIDGCSPAEVRAMRVSDQPLPPPARGTCFEVLATGGFRRRALPERLMT